MKKIRVVLFYFTMLLVLSSCGENEQTESPTSTSPSIEVSMPISKNAPSPDTISTDIAEALAQKNPYATVTNIEPVKSLTNEGSYQITVNVTAESVYADWEYEADLYYTKYDQGWMVDPVDWNTENYTLTRIPDSDAMSAIADNFLSSYDDTRLNDMAPVQSGNVILYPDSFDTGILSFEWKAVTESLKHAQYAVSYSSEWAFDPSSDSWHLLEEADPDTYRYCGFTIKEKSKTLAAIADFSGNWYDALTISNFSPNGFDLTWNGKEMHCTEAFIHPVNYGGGEDLWYVYEDPSSSEDNLYITLLFSSKYTFIQIASSNNKLLQQIMIEDPLPMFSIEYAI